MLLISNHTHMKLSEIRVSQSQNWVKINLILIEYELFPIMTPFKRIC